ncbi:MAG: TetR/AcrR family transcriptional regulator [Aggregatilineales bacterium]
MEITDRRVRRTYRLLGDALMALIHEKGYENITIKDITDEADVAYVTFFRHFKDIDELLLQTLDALIDEVIEQIRVAAADIDQSNMQQCLEIEGRIIFEHAAQNRILYKTLLNQQISLKTYRAIQGRIADAMMDDARKTLKVMTPAMPPEKSSALQLSAYHSAGAILTLLAWWLEQPENISPAMMGDTFAKLVSIPVNALIMETMGLTTPAFLHPVQSED